MPEEANDGDVLDMARQYFGHGNWNAKYWLSAQNRGKRLVKTMISFGALRHGAILVEGS